MGEEEVTSHTTVLLSIHKIMEKIDSKVISTQDATTELILAACALRTGLPGVLSVILASVFDSLSSGTSADLKRIERFKVLKNIIEEKWSESTVLEPIKSTFELAFLSVRKKERESLALKKQLHQPQKKKNWKFTEEILFETMTDTLTLDFPEQLTIAAALSSSPIKSLNLVGQRSLYLLLSKLCFERKMKLSSAAESADLSFYSLPNVDLSSEKLMKMPKVYLNAIFSAVSTSSIKGEVLKQEILKSLYFEDDLSKFFDLYPLLLSEKDWISFDSVEGTAELKTLNKSKKERAKLLSGIIVDNCGPSFSSVSSLHDYFKNLVDLLNAKERSSSGINEVDVAFVLMGLLKVASEAESSEEEGLREALDLSLAVLEEDLNGKDFKLVLEEKCPENRKIDSFQKLWSPDILVKVMIKLKKESGLFSVAKVLEIMSESTSKELSFKSCSSDFGLKWMFSVLSELNVKDKKVDVTSVFSSVWVNKVAQSCFLKFLVERMCSQSQTDDSSITFFVKGQKKPFELKNTSLLLIKLSSFGLEAIVQSIFMQLFTLEPSSREKALMHLISSTNDTEDTFLLTSCKEITTPLLQEKLVYQLLSLALRSKTIPIFQKAWTKGGKFSVTRFFLDQYKEKRDVIDFFCKTLEQSPDANEFVSKLSPTSDLFAEFIFDFVVKAFSLELLSSWLTEKLSANTTPQEKCNFVTWAVKFMLARFPGSKNVTEGVFPALSLSVCKLFISKLGSAVEDFERSEVPQEELMEVRKVLEVCANRLNSQNSAFQSSNDAHSSPRLSPNVPPQEEVESRGKEIFKAIFSGQRPIRDVLGLLKRYKESASSLEQEVFEYVLKSLLDEFKFLDKYRERELKIIGAILGLMIKHELISSFKLALVLKSILRALRSPPSSKYFRFGFYALEQFKSRLLELKDFSTQLISIPALRNEAPELIKELSLALNRGSPRVQPQSQSTEANNEALMHLRWRLEKEYNATLQLPLRGQEDPEEFMLFCEALDEIVGVSEDSVSKVESPDSSLEDKLKFIVNNLTKGNVSEKSGQAKVEIQKNNELWKWIVEYLVSHRVSQQANFHSVYLEFLESLKVEGLFEEVRKRTILSVKDKMKNQKLVGSSTERTVVKNLGGWLGKVTLLKQTPILAEELDLKELILDAYERGWLIAVVPFVKKILEAAKPQRELDEDGEDPVLDYNFQIFSPSNPWIVGILNCFAELYTVQDLKLNLKFEIEVLCNELNVKLKDLTPTRLLPFRKRPKLEGNPDFNLKTPAKLAERQRMQAKELAQRRHRVQQQLQRLRPMTRQPQGRPLRSPKPAKQDFSTQIPNLANYVVIKPNIALFLQLPQLKRLVPLALDRAITDVIQPVAERACTIASATTRELIKKDFAAEWDEKRLRTAAHKTVASLAASLASVTCKESLRASLEGNLKQVLAHGVKSNESINPSDIKQDVFLSAVHETAAANLNLGTRLIEKVAVDKALRDVDSMLEPLYSIRIRSREQAGKKYFDAATVRGSGRELPDFLNPKPKPNGIDIGFLQVYDAFRLPSNRVSTTSTQPQSPHSRQSSEVNAVMEEWKVSIANIDSIVKECLQKKSVTQAAHAEVGGLIKRVVEFGKTISVVASRDEAAAMFANRMFRRVFESAASPNSGIADKFRAQAHHALLDGFVNLCQNIDIKKKLSEWVFATNLENRFHRYTTLSLIRSRSLSLPDFDICLAKVIESEASSLNISFALDLLKLAVIEKRFISAKEFAHTTQILEKLNQTQIQRGELKMPSLHQVLEQLKQTSSPKSSSKETSDLGTVRNQMEQKKRDHPPGLFLRSPEPPVLRKQVAKFLHAWMKLYASVESEGHTIFTAGPHQSKFQAYLTSLQQHGALSGEDNTDTFFKLCAELVIESALTNFKPPMKVNGPTMLSYAATDALSKLILLLVKYAKASAKLRLIGKVVDNIASIFLREVENRTSKNVPETIDQRPYYRLFSSLMRDLTKLYKREQSGQPSKYEMLFKFGEVYHTKLKPTLAPGFAFAWLRLFTEKSFLVLLLRCPESANNSLKQRSEEVVLSLLGDLLSFLSQFLHESENISFSVKQLYFATLKLFFVLKHDFPDFLAENSTTLLEMIPSICVQLKNIVCSAVPTSYISTVKDLDPIKMNFSFSEISTLLTTERKNNFDLNAMLKKKQKLSTLLTDCITKDVQTYVSELIKCLLLQENSDQSRNPNNCVSNFDLNSIAVATQFLGVTAASKLRQSKSLIDCEEVKGIASTNVFSVLCQKLNNDGRYFLLSSILNNITFPNLTTNYFSKLLLFLFLEGGEVVQEQIARVLVERVVVQKPHPWGVLLVFGELMKNKKYSFWSRKFLTSSQEANGMFERVSRSVLATTEKSKDKEQQA